MYSVHTLFFMFSTFVYTDFFGENILQMTENYLQIRNCIL